MRMFELVRHHDVSGVSGTGIVAEGVVWTDGAVALRWYGEHPSTADWLSLDDLLAVHGHEGDTTVHFLAAVDCWLCQGLGGIAIHNKWTEVRGRPLWTAHEIPTADDHPVWPCPVCAAVTTANDAAAPPTPKQLADWTLAEERALDAADNEAGD
jgi:hypothetical protein